MEYKTVIFDMDGTLANIDERRKSLEQDPKDWKSFNFKLGTDTPNDNICELATMYYDLFFHIVICTVRFEAVREKTFAQLDEWGILHSELLMRENDDYRPDAELKKEMLEKLKKNYNVIVAVDDRDSVVKMWRDNNLTCLQVAPGNF